ncbi:MAG TPA: 4-hydroxyphenylacetate 3-hydroxylase N-terminal domain-containing protein [Myxococcota bacterium]|nr:4-hydroxyphenylacetate 3-hydroxylase N-terminal domain-containing protein [Myxococcota bacterium]
MGARTGEQFLESLRDGRELWLDGERVGDPTVHPALAGAAHLLAEIFDLQHAHAAACLAPDPETGEPINVSHLIPGSRADLERRRVCLERIAELTVGVMGRTPDYMNVTFAGFAGRSDEWGAFGNEAGAENLVRFQKQMRRGDLALTHTIIHPTVDKSLPDVAGGGGDVALHKIESTARGIVVRGARVLATLAPFSNEIAVYPGHPIPPIDGGRYALAFSIPCATPGLRFLCRDSTTRGTNRFDHPFSSRFDEQDAFVIFDDVEVPRERIFIDGNVDVYNAVLATGWYPNVMQQTMIRAQTKLEFAYGLGCRMAELIGDKSPATSELLGEIFGYAELTRAALRTAEAEAFEWGNGVWFPNGGPLAQLRHFLPVWMPRVNEILRLVGSHNLLATPTEAQVRDPELGPLLAKYLQGAGGASAETRIRVFRLAWDFAASALGSRGEQYERFYLASAARNRLLAHLFAPKERSRKLVDRFLEEKSE